MSIATRPATGFAFDPASRPARLARVCTGPDFSESRSAPPCGHPHITGTLQQLGVAIDRLGDGEQLGVIAIEAIELGSVNVRRYPGATQQRS